MNPTSLATRKPHKLPADKNPLHPSALRIRDLRPGRPITVFDPIYGVQGHYIVVSVPYKEESYPRHGCLKVRLRSLTTGDVIVMSLESMGILPSVRDGWRLISRFTIDRRKRHLLPSPAINRIPSFPDDPEYDEDEEEDYESVDGVNHDGMSWSL